MPARTVLLLLGCCVPTLAMAQVPAGGEFQVNTYTTAFQGTPSAGMDAGGRLVVSWVTPQFPFTGAGVIGRRFDVTGAPASSEFIVSMGGGAHISPNLAAAYGGSFVVAWMTTSVIPVPIVVEGQAFTSAGSTLGVQFRVTSNESRAPAVAWSPTGGFLLAWHQAEQPLGDNNDVWGQLFDAAGTKVGAEFAINTYTASNQRSPSVAFTAQGSFLVTWQSTGQDGSNEGVYARRFSPAGAALGAEFRVNEVTTSDQTVPRAAAIADGGFVVVWQSYGQDGSGNGIFGRRFGSDGTPLGAEFRVNSYTTSSQYEPSVAADLAGNFVVSWTSLGQDGSLGGVFAQRFDALGQRRGTEFRANATTTDAQMRSAVAVDPYGNMSVVWQSANQDGSIFGVFGQRFGGLFGVALEVDTSGNRVLEPGEAVDVRPSWYNLNGAAQTAGGVLTILAGPTGATYTITDPDASYGTVANRAIAPCVDCYGIAVSSPPVRPQTHWDAFALEAIVPDAHGQRKPWVLHVGGSFADVSSSSPFNRFIETLLHRGVTGGCTATTYCPSASTTREQMAVFALVAKEGTAFAPPPCAPPNLFGDVPDTSPFCRWVEELASRGVVGGCGGGNYCPQAAATREQMAVFMLRTLDPALDPPACEPPNLFADVPETSPFCRWIEELARRGVVAGCGGGNYCPAADVTREQMSVFIGATFALTLYGP